MPEVEGDGGANVGGEGPEYAEGGLALEVVRGGGGLELG